VLLFAAHLYVGGATYGRSERSLHVSEAYASRSEALPAVSYAALGHIHKPQGLAGGAPARYAGSPIQLDFGEEGEDKTVVVVDAKPGRPAVIEPRPLRAGRSLLRISGPIEDIASHAANAAGKLVHVTVQSEDPIPDVSDQVADLLPGAVILEVAEDIASRRLSVVTDGVTDRAVEPSMGELFETYLGQVGTRSGSASAVLESFRNVLESIEMDTPPVLAGQDALEPVEGRS
jgi:exonuclease SbcD